MLYWIWATVYFYPLILSIAEDDGAEGSHWDHFQSCQMLKKYWKLLYG